MDAANRTFHLIAFAVTAVLLLIFSGGMASWTMMSGGGIGALSWMWLPSLLLVTLGAAGFAVLFDRNK